MNLVEGKSSQAENNICMRHMWRFISIAKTEKCENVILSTGRRGCRGGSLAQKHTL